jgi:hypothetical protein
MKAYEARACSEARPDSLAPAAVSAVSSVGHANSFTDYRLEGPAAKHFRRKRAEVIRPFIAWKCAPYTPSVQLSHSRALALSPVLMRFVALRAQAGICQEERYMMQVGYIYIYVLPLLLPLLMLLLARERSA